jgi:hypothetical protein
VAHAPSIQTNLQHGRKGAPLGVVSTLSCRHCILRMVIDRQRSKEKMGIGSSLQSTSECYIGGSFVVNVTLCLSTLRKMRLQPGAPESCIFSVPWKVNNQAPNQPQSQQSHGNIHNISTASSQSPSHSIWSTSHSTSPCMRSCKGGVW